MATEVNVFGESNTLRASFPAGTVVAALLAAMIGLLVLSAVNICSNVDSGFKTTSRSMQALDRTPGKRFSGSPDGS